MRTKRTRDILVVGFALFAMFLGAANIIFPPFMGARAGHYWILVCLGFVLTGTGLPVLGVVATALSGGSADSALSKVSPKFARVLNILLVLFIGPLFAVPRTAATTIELSVRPFLPQSIPIDDVRLVGSALFFAICLYFVLSPGKAIDRIGTVLTPVLVLSLLTLIVLSIVTPMGKPVAPYQNAGPVNIFHFGFTTGYQTMDAMAALIFGGTIFSSLLDKGYDLKEAKKMMWPIAAVSGVSIMVVYLGFIWIGASGSAHLQGITEKTALTMQAVELLAGRFGQIVLAIVIFLACCTTAIGLIMTAANYFVKVFNNRISYKALALTITGLSYAISILGVESIILLAAPVLELIYPVVIIVICMNLFGGRIHFRYAYWGAIIAAAPAAILNVLRLFIVSRPIADAWLPYFPLGDAGFGCFIPAILGAFFGDWLAKSRLLKGTLPSGIELPPLHSGEITFTVMKDDVGEDKPTPDKVKVTTDA